jgi:two-component system C4-dicarboxylate transport response regulator DctD
MKKLRILVVEDEGPLSFFVTQTLKEDFDVVLAKTAEQALSIFEPGKFDLIITDVRLPGKSGLELLSEVLIKDPDIKSIIVTAYDSFEVREKARALNADAFLPKPFTVQTLKETIKDIFKEKNQYFT